MERRLGRGPLLFRVAEAVVGVSTIGASLFVAGLVAGPGRAAALGSNRLEALVGAALDARTSGMDLVLVLVGVGGTIFCGLLFSSRLVPRWLAAWGVVTYLSMLVLGFVSLIWSAHPAMLEVVFYGPGALFELTIGVWLLVKGVDERQWRAVATRGSSY
jgi:hypothetical protein